MISHPCNILLSIFWTSCWKWCFGATRKGVFHNMGPLNTLSRYQTNNETIWKTHLVEKLMLLHKRTLQFSCLFYINGPYWLQMGHFWGDCASWRFSCFLKRYIYICLPLFLCLQQTEEAAAVATWSIHWALLQKNCEKHRQFLEENKPNLTGRILILIRTLSVKTHFKRAPGVCLTVLWMHVFKFCNMWCCFPARGNFWGARWVSSQWCVHQVVQSFQIEIICDFCHLSSNVRDARLV